jgi:cytochrome c oxidase cbb3-type subunit 3/ubiquinol-cytochrome c reductase cytochrome c subunit
MRARALLEALLLVGALVASGTLECGGIEPTLAERQGEKLYGRMCAVCHGADGEGYRADEATALAHPAFLASVSDGLLRAAIATGRAGTTMSAWSTSRGGPLSRAEVDALVAFLRSRSSAPRAALDERPARGEASRGMALYARECARCHGAHGVEGPNVHIGNSDFLATASNGFLRYAIAGGRARTAMPAFAPRLGEGDIEDLVAFLRSLQSSEPQIAAPAPPARMPPLPLGPVPLHPRGPEPVGFRPFPATAPVDLVKAQLDRGARMGLLDARAPSDYAAEHIAGAVSVPFYDPAPYFSQLPKDAWLVCYCACPHAESGTLAQKLEAAGFSRVTVLDEGLGVWRAHHYATKTGIDP